MPRKDKIQLRRDTSTNWTTADPVLAVGEAGFETDTSKLKVGDGSSAWTSLGYATTLPTDSRLSDTRTPKTHASTHAIGGSDPIGALVPTGCIMAWPTATPPTGWLLCNGQSTTGYTALAALVGSTVPDMQGRVPVGKNSGTFATLGAKDGAETHALTTAEMPAHTHTQNPHQHDFQGQTFSWGGGVTGVVYAGVNAVAGTSAGNNLYTYQNADGWADTYNETATNQSTGGGGAHNNLQPYIVLNYIIKT